MMENMMQEVAQTLCTMPDARTAPSKHKTTSGNNLVWKFFPNIEDSRLPSPVKEKMKNKDPRRPPRMVLSCDDDSHCLYICIPENMMTANIKDMRNELPLNNAIAYTDGHQLARNRYPQFLFQLLFYSM